MLKHHKITTPRHRNNLDTTRIRGRNEPESILIGQFHAQGMAPILEICDLTLISMI